MAGIVFRLNARTSFYRRNLKNLFAFAVANGELHDEVRL